MKRYERPEMSVTFVKNTDIISISAINALTQLGDKFDRDGIKYRSVVFR